VAAVKDVKCDYRVWKDPVKKFAIGSLAPFDGRSGEQSPLLNTSKNSLEVVFLQFAQTAYLWFCFTSGNFFRWAIASKRWLIRFVVKLKWRNIKLVTSDNNIVISILQSPSNRFRFYVNVEVSIVVPTFMNIGSHVRELQPIIQHTRWRLPPFYFCPAVNFEDRDVMADIIYTFFSNLVMVLSIAQKLQIIIWIQDGGCHHLSRKGQVARWYWHIQKKHHGRS
jgi:hypothetical protein